MGKGELIPGLDPKPLDRQSIQLVTMHLPGQAQMQWNCWFEIKIRQLRPAIVNFGERSRYQIGTLTVSHLVMTLQQHKLFRQRLAGVSPMTIDNIPEQVCPVLFNRSELLKDSIQPTGHVLVILVTGCGEVIDDQGIGDFGAQHI